MTLKKAHRSKLLEMTSGPCRRPDQGEPRVRPRGTFPSMIQRSVFRNAADAVLKVLLVWGTSGGASASAASRLLAPTTQGIM